MKSSEVRCTHWRECGVKCGGCCLLNVYRKPSYSVCLLVCDQYDGPKREGTETLDLRSKLQREGKWEPCGKKRNDHVGT